MTLFPFHHQNILRVHCLVLAQRGSAGATLGWNPATHGMQEQEVTVVTVTALLL